jgi:hypothetical protein
MEKKLKELLEELDKSFTSPFDLDKFYTQIVEVLTLAQEKENLSQEEKFLLRKLIHKLSRFEEVVKTLTQSVLHNFKFEGRI